MTNPNFVVINRENMTFFAAADSMQKATLISWNDCPDFETVVLPLEQRKFFSTFGVLELLLLYKNTTGQIGDLHDYNGMIQKCHELATLVPIDPRSLSQLENKAAQLPVIPPPPKVPNPPIVVRANQVSTGVNPFVAASADPAPKNPSKPSPKGATGRVWEIADAVFAEIGGLIDKPMRAKIIERCEAVGIHPATAATQFSKWKASK